MMPPRTAMVFRRDDSVTDIDPVDWNLAHFKPCAGLPMAVIRHVSSGLVFAIIDDPIHPRNVLPYYAVLLGHVHDENGMCLSATDATIRDVGREAIIAYFADIGAIKFTYQDGEQE